MTLKKGSLIFTSAQGGGLISRGIKWSTRKWFEPPTKASHTAIVVEPSKHVMDTLIVEQTFPEIGVTALGKYGDVPWWCFEGKYLTDDNRVALAEAACKASGAYGVGKIGLFLADSLLSKSLSLVPAIAGLALGKRWSWDIRLFSRLDFTKTYVCSQFVGKLYHDVLNMDFGRDWKVSTPDDQMDYCESSTAWSLAASNETSYL